MHFRVKTFVQIVAPFDKECQTQTRIYSKSTHSQKPELNMMEHGHQIYWWPLCVCGGYKQKGMLGTGCDTHCPSITHILPDSDPVSRTLSFCVFSIKLLKVLYLSFYVKDFHEEIGPVSSECCIVFCEPVKRLGMKIESSHFGETFCCFLCSFNQ